MIDFNKYIDNELKISTDIKKKFISKNKDKIINTANMFALCQKKGAKVLYFGNGGSASDSQHLAAEHINKLKIKRNGFAGIALTTDTSVITSVANDMSFKYIFSRQIEALGKKDDISVAISTSGNSENIIEGLTKSRELGIKTIAFTGGDGGKIMKDNLADVILNVEGSNFSARIQETHIFIGHLLIELMDEILIREV